MQTIDKVLESFVNGDYFILFIVLTLSVLLVLVLALIKSRNEYNELLMSDETKNRDKDEDSIKDLIDFDDEDILKELSSLQASTNEDIINEDKPLVKQIDIDSIKSYDEVVKDYESFEEENAVISREELEQRAQERRDALGDTENQIAIAQYEEEQEKKAIISYEQLVQNASNITLTYKEEENKKDDAPRVTKIEVEEHEVTSPEVYLEQEEFLKILKEFRISLNENIFN